MKRTALYKKHLECNAKIVEFDDWELPMYYDSHIKEHCAVRLDAGMFDLSYKNIVDIQGEEAYEFLRILITADVSTLEQGQYLYSYMLDQDAKIINDLMVYCQDKNKYRLILNTIVKDKDIIWLNKQAQNFIVTVELKNDLAIIAVQGPKADTKVFTAIGGTQEMCNNIKAFNAISVGSLFIAKTNYLKEDGFEIILPSKAAIWTWQMLLDAGVTPCGFVAMDSLYLEAGIDLYNNSMPLMELYSTQTIDFNDNKRNFIGKNNLISNYVVTKGFIEDQDILYIGQIIKTNLGEAVITSSAYSPILDKFISLVKIHKEASFCEVNINGINKQLQIVNPIFIDNNYN